MFSNLLADTQLGRSRTQDFYGVHLFLKLVLSPRGPPALAEDKIQSKALNHHRGTQWSLGNKPSKTVYSPDHRQSGPRELHPALSHGDGK